MNELKIVATIIAKAEFKDEVLRAMQGVADATREEEGNISYVLYEDIKNPLKLIILEEWKSQEAISFHNRTPHYITFKREITGKVESVNADIIREIY